MSGLSIEARSFEILAERADLSRFGPMAARVVARVIHASADLDYVSTMMVDDSAVEAGVAALRAGAPVVTDVEMVRHGISGADACCHLPSGSTVTGDVDGHGGLPSTRAAAGIRSAAVDHPDGAIVIVGCAPTALFEVIRLWREELFRPALVVGMPVGFVGAAESKAALRATPLPAVSNVGEKGGSAVAAAAFNALTRLVEHG